MIETYLLNQLVAFAQFGTLSEAAKQLNLSQSALSRSMQKLEQIIAVELFSRKRNSIVLNDNGKLAAKLAQEILLQHQAAIERIRDFDRKNRTISLGCCAPVPLNQVIFLLTRFFPETAFSSELQKDEHLLEGLRNDYFNLVVLHKKPTDQNLFFVKCGAEKLFLSIPLSHPFALKDGIYLEELNGEKVLLYSKIGFWYDLCHDKAPNAKFLVQTERDTFNQLVDASAFLSFTNDVFIKNGYAQKNCVHKPILNAEADVTYYCICKLSQHERFKNFLEFLSTQSFTQTEIVYNL